MAGGAQWWPLLLLNYDFSTEKQTRAAYFSLKGVSFLHIPVGHTLSLSDKPFDAIWRALRFLTVLL